MTLRWRYLMAAVALVAASAGLGMAQQETPTKTAAEIKAEQTPDSIASTSLCEWAVEQVADSKAKGTPLSLWFNKTPMLDQRQNFTHDGNLLDLRSLYDASDEVVLVMAGFPHAETVAPSGRSAITYLDVQVLRSWKGIHKAGDVLTYSVPTGEAICPAARVSSLPPAEWGAGTYLNVLFLRQSKDLETQTTPGLRLAGGYGFQGQILLPFSTPMSLTPPACRSFVNFTPWNKDAMDQNIQSCNDFVDKLSDPIAFQSRQDPIAIRYSKMPISDFLREMQSVAGSTSASKNK
jgi:hypothetical protein